MGFPRFLPRARYPLFRPRKINAIIKKLEREVQLDALFGGILSIRIIYGWLWLDSKIELSRLRLEKTQLVINRSMIITRIIKDFRLLFVKS